VARNKLPENERKFRVMLAKVRYRYGRIAARMYEVLFLKQRGRCAICGQPAGKRALNLDHCHRSFRVRGLLCGPCNRALGLFADSIDRLEKAIQYLRDNG
jgi:hypothetical protein